MRRVRLELRGSIERMTCLKGRGGAAAFDLLYVAYAADVGVLSSTYQYFLRLRTVS